MRILAVLAALFLLACPPAARAALPGSGCPDILVGDSLAVGMGPYARAAGFEVVARTGIGLAWLRAQNPRCARRVVVVLGTNDLRGIDPYSAEAYPARLAAIMGRWQAQQITWATPGCFPYDDSLERGSEALDRALAREPLVRVGSGRDYMRVHSGRTARCSYLSGDGIHPTGAGYRAWWASLSQAIGPAPEGEDYREARTFPETYARPGVRSVQHARSGRSFQSAAARSTRPGRQARLMRDAPRMARARDASRAGPTREASRARPTREASRRVLTRDVAQARPARPGRPAQLARGRPPGSVQQATAARPARAAAQARAERPAQPPARSAGARTAARPAPHARSAAPAHPSREARPSRPPAPSRQAAAGPIRRT